MLSTSFNKVVLSHSCLVSLLSFLSLHFSCSGEVLSGKANKGVAKTKEDW